MSQEGRNHLSERLGRLLWKAWFSGCHGIPDSLGIRKLKLSFKRTGSCAGLCHSCPFSAGGGPGKFATWREMAVKTAPRFPFSPASVNNTFWCLLKGALWVAVGEVLWAGGHLKNETVSDLTGSRSRGEQILLIWICLIRLLSQLCDVIRSVGITWQLEEGWQRRLGICWMSNS